MGRHAIGRLTNVDRQLNATMRATWVQLPTELRRTAGNIAAIRIGVLAYAIVLPASIAKTAEQSTPAEFASYLLGFTPIAGVVGLIAAVGILYWRATRTSPRFVAAYKELMPGFTDRIEERFGEPGLGDVFAPWVRSRRNLLSGLLGRIARRFSLRP